MKFSELIECCIECIKSYNPIIKTIDSHADDFLNSVFYSFNIFNSSKILMRKFSSNKCFMDASDTKNYLK